MREQWSEKAADIKEHAAEEMKALVKSAVQAVEDFPQSDFLVGFPVGPAEKRPGVWFTLYQDPRDAWEDGLRRSETAIVLTKEGLHVTKTSLASNTHYRQVPCLSGMREASNDEYLKYSQTALSFLKGCIENGAPDLTKPIKRRRRTHHYESVKFA